MNDGSTVDNLIILQESENPDSRIIIDQPHSGLAAAVRNEGLKLATGEFVAILDSDDKIEKDYLNKLISRYHQTHADIVLSLTKFWDYQTDSITSSITGLRGNLDLIISGKNAFLLSLRWEIGGWGICKSSILQPIGYDTIGMNGGEYTTRLLFLNANAVAFSDAINYYRNNQDLTTKKFSIKYFDVHPTQYRLYQLIKNGGFNDSLVKYWKEYRVKSLVHHYTVYFNRRNQLSSSDRKKVLNTFRINTENLRLELLHSPKLDSKFKSFFYSLIATNYLITGAFALLLSFRKKLKLLLMAYKLPTHQHS